MRIFVLFFCLLTVFSCRSDRRLVSFFMYYPNIRLNIPSGLSGILPRVYSLDLVPSNIKSFLPAGLDTALITRIEPVSARLVTLDESISFYWLRELSIRICQDKSLACQTAEEVFYQNELALRRPALEIDLFPTLINARKHLIKNSFKLEVLFYLQDITPREIPARLEMEFAAYQ
ncbi:MAG: hypothetical protein ACK5ZX_01415 [Bacteroidota bacterium]